MWDLNNEKNSNFKVSILLIPHNRNLLLFAFHYLNFFPPHIILKGYLTHQSHLLYKQRQYTTQLCFTKERHLATEYLTTLGRNMTQWFTGFQEEGCCRLWLTVPDLSYEVSLIINHRVSFREVKVCFIGFPSLGEYSRIEQSLGNIIMVKTWYWQI